MSRERANQLLQQADANDTWAVISPPKDMKKLRKAARAMREEAMRLIDQEQVHVENNLSDEELLQALGGDVTT